MEDGGGAHSSQRLAQRVLSSAAACVRAFVCVIYGSGSRSCALRSDSHLLQASNVTGEVLPK